MRMYLQVCASLLAKLIMDLFMGPGPGPAYPLVLNMLRAALRSSSPKVRVCAALRLFWFFLYVRVCMHARIMCPPCLTVCGMTACTLLNLCGPRYWYCCRQVRARAFDLLYTLSVHSAMLRTEDEERMLAEAEAAAEMGAAAWQVRPA